MNVLSKLTGQVTKFSIVGLLNTGIDFLVTNLLFLLLSPQSMGGLTLISVAACIAAASNSYFFNSRWTFTDQVDDSGQKQRFFMIAAVGLVVNTAGFLFVAKYLPLLLPVNDITNLNIAKLCGVVTAMGVTFIGYKFGVFYSASVLEFKNKFTFDAEERLKPSSILAVLIIGLISRAVFLYMSPVAYGNAINYSWLALYISEGNWSQIDPFWHSLFDYWQAIFLYIGLSQYSALVVSSLIPGVLLLVPVILIARDIFGSRVALISGFFLAMHPRLIEYSLNGYEESLYLLGLLTFIYTLQRFVQNDFSFKNAVHMSLSIAFSFLVRNESIFLIAFLLLAVGFKARKCVEPKRLFVSLIGATIFSLLYVWANFTYLDSSGLFSKVSNLYKPYAETLDFAHAAKQTYSLETVSNSDRPLISVLPTLLERWPENLLYVAERMPGMLLSPIIVFALLLPLITKSSARLGSIKFLTIFTIWPVLFYPFIQLEPRMLFPLVIGSSVFGVAGALALIELISDSSFTSRFHSKFKSALPLLLIVLLVPLIPALAWNSEQTRGYHHIIGDWISENLPRDVGVTGDGYGYVNTSTFWAGIEGEPRIWTDDPKVLVSNSLANDKNVILLYEEYIQEANPELLNVMNGSFPGMSLLKEFSFPRVGRVQIWISNTDLGIK